MTSEEILSKIQFLYPNVYRNDKKDVLISSFEKMSPVIKKALEAFLQNNEHQEINLLGYSVDNLVKEHGLNEVAAYLTLDAIIREPDITIESLKKSHDFVGLEEEIKSEEKR